MVDESQVITVVKKIGIHSDLINSIQYISCTDHPLIMTGSTDRLVKIMKIENSEARVVGTLKQGYKTMPNYQWDFPIRRHLKEHPDRKTRMETILDEVRQTRDKDLSYKKKKEIELITAGKMTSYGFQGAQLTGMSMANNTQMYNTQQPGVPGGAGTQSQAKFGATNSSAYNTFGGAGAYATNTS